MNYTGFYDDGICDAPPHIAAIAIGITASPLSIALAFTPVWPGFALTFVMVAFPLSVILGIPAGVLVRRRLALTFFHCMAVGGGTGFLAALAVMGTAAVCDWYYAVGSSFLILVLGGAICGGIAFPWIRWLNRSLLSTGNS